MPGLDPGISSNLASNVWVKPAHDDGAIKKACRITRSR